MVGPGSAERELLRAGARYALGLRVGITALTTVAAVVFDDAGDLWALLAVAVVLNGWTVYYAYRFPRRGRWMVPVDIAVVAGVCLSQAWTSHGVAAEGISWVIGVLGIVLTTYAWQLDLVTHAVATVVIMACFLVGAALADPEGWLAVAPIQLWAVVEAALSRGLYHLVRGGARRADTAVARNEAVRREAAVAEARRSDEREYLAALHDTASATLLMVGAGVADRRQGWLSEQAGRDLEVINGAYGTPTGDVDLIEHLREVTRHTPLTIRWDVPPALVVPAVDASILSHGVREALTNVVRHAGVDRASVVARHDGDHVVVEVADEGVGFDTTVVAAHRYGVTRSIVERMERTGGRAEVVSSPGRGTTVRLERVPASPDPGMGEFETISTRVGQALRWAAVLMNLAILFGLDLPKLVAAREHYQPLWAQVGTFAALTAVTVVVAWHLWRGRSLGALRIPLALLVFAVSIPATASVPPEYRLGVVHWSEADAAWTLVLVIMDFRFGVFIAVLLAHYAMTFAQTALGGDAGITVGESVDATLIVLGYQFSVGMIATILRPISQTAATIAERDERLRTAEAVSARVHQDRKDRYAALGETTAPLLAGLASGGADPGDPAVRRACAVEAARMRRLFAEDATVPDPLAHELRACVEMAERNGVTVLFAERGARPPVPTETRRALTEPAVAALATAASTARVTLVGSGDEVTVSVIADAPVDLPVTASAGVELATLASGDKLWIKATWRRRA